FFEHGNIAARHALSDFKRTLDLHDAVDNAVIEAGVVDQGTCARRRPYSINHRTLATKFRDQIIQIEFRSNRSASTTFNPVRTGKTSFLLLQEKLFNGRICRIHIAPRRVDAYRSAVRRNSSGMKYAEAEIPEQRLKAGQRIVPEVLVIDGVVLQSLNQVR